MSALPDVALVRAGLLDRDCLSGVCRAQGERDFLCFGEEREFQKLCLCGGASQL